MVSLIENGDLDRVKAHVALTHEVLETTGTRDDDVDASAQLALLALLAHAAKDCGGTQTICGGERGDHRVDLRRKLTGGSEHESAGLTGTGPTTGATKAGDKRNGECEGLAGPCATTAEHIATSKGVRKGVFLNGERH